MSEHIHHTTFDLQVQIHKKYSHEKFLMVNTELCVNPKIGPVAAMIYAALLGHFRKLTADEESPNYKSLQDNGGWFYISESQISKTTGWPRRSVGDAVKKIVGKLIARKKVEVGKTLRHTYCFLDWQEGGGECRLGEASVASIRARTLYTKNNNINTGHIFNKRKSIPGETSKYKKKQNVDIKPKTKQNLPNADEVNLAGFMFKQIKKLYPKHYPNRTWEACHISWSKTIKRVVKQLNGNIELLQNALEWMWKSDHRQASFLKENIRSADALLKSWQNGVALHVLIENYEKYGAEKSENIDAQIKAMVEKNAPEGYTEDDKEQVFFEILDIRDDIDSVNKRLLGNLKFYWHTTNAFLKTAQWLMELELNSDYSPCDIMDEYLEFLNWKLQEGKIDTLAPWMFSNSSGLFIEFINQRYNTTGRKVVNWQRGDYE